MDKIMNCLIL